MWHRCNICITSFLTESERDKHTLEMHGMIEEKGNKRQKISCHYCNCTFTGRAALNSHMRIVHPHIEKEEDHTCVYCKFKFSEKAPLDIHMAIMHPNNKMEEEEEGSFTCPHCKFIFTEKPPLDIHMAIMHPNDQCNTIPPGLDATDANMLEGENMHDVKCPICLEQYMLTDGVLSHTCNTQNQSTHSLDTTATNSDKKETTVICPRCSISLSSWMAFYRHKRTCSYAAHNALEQKGDNKNNHNGKIKTFQCKICNAHFLTTHRLYRHKRETDCRRESDSNQTLRCNTCGEHFTGRRRLFQHKMRMHNQQGGGRELQQRPWEEGEDPFQEVENGDLVREAYELHESYILAPNEYINEVVEIHNYPIPNRIDEEMIESHMREIYLNSENSYKLQIGVGLIMETREHTLDGEEEGEPIMRYFRPGQNSYILTKPLSIYNPDSLEEAIETINEMQMQEYVLRLKPNTAVKVRFITQIQYFIWNTGFAIGDDDSIILPQYLTMRRSIVTHTKTSRNKNYVKNLCFFTSLAQYYKYTPGCDSNSLKDVHRHSIILWNQWRAYAVDNGIQISADINDYSGVELAHMHIMESCFNIRINIYELQSDLTALTRHVSISKYDDKVNMNLYGNHLNLITGFKQYARKYACHCCEKMFRTAWLLNRHGTACVKKTKHKFQGGYIGQHESLFEKLAHIGVVIPQQDRSFTWFATWDMEAILEVIPGHDIGSDETESITPDQCNGTGLKFTQKHIPVSCSICSNVDGYREPICHVKEQPMELIKAMMETFGEIREVVLRAALEKWGMYLEQLESKIENRKLVIEREEREREGERVNNVVEEDEISEETESEEGGYCGIHDVERGVDESEKKKKNKKKGAFANEDILIKQYNRIRAQFLRYISQLPLVSFNGARYDIQLIRGELVHYMLEKANEDEDSDSEDNAHEATHGGEVFGEMGGGAGACEYVRKAVFEKYGSLSIIKQGMKYSTISNNHFVFLDISCYLAPHTTYSKFLSAMEVREKKFYFPYQFVTEYGKLEQTFLPPYNDPGWYSSLQKSHILEVEYNSWVFKQVDVNNPSSTAPETGLEIYARILDVWNTEGFQSMRDLLVYYNNLDTQPMTIAVSRLCQMFYDQDVDCLKEIISIPGAARIIMMSEPKQNGIRFPIFDEKDKDIHYMMKANLVAGASLVFTRSQEVGKPLARPNGEECKSIEGYDCNALYLYGIKQSMPSGEYVRRARDNGFKPVYRRQYRAMYAWLHHKSEEDGLFIRSKMTTGTEVRVGRYLCDGYAITHNNACKIYEYHGCWVHQHQDPLCPINKSQTIEQREELLYKHERTVKKRNALLAMGYEVEEIYECQFRERLRHRPDLKRIMSDLSPKFWNKHRGVVTEERLIQAIRNEDIFGFLLVDIHVPEDDRERWDDFPPIFSNQNITRENIGVHMQDFLEGQDTVKFNKPRRLLVTGMMAKNILLSTSILKWYLEHGLVISQIHEVIEFCETKPFVNFVENITKLRKEGARDPRKQPISEFYKLIGNSSYGSMLLDRGKFTRTNIVMGDHDARLMVNDTYFRDLTPLKHGCYEVSRSHAQIRMSLPIYIGFQILQEAKIRMLQFAHDFIAKYIPRQRFCYLQSDTDSLYCSLAGESLVDSIADDKKQKIEAQLLHQCGDRGPHPQAFLPRTCCEEHNFDDNKTSGLFKLEFRGSKMICLSSKTYVGCASDNTIKVSSKGVGKRALLRANPMEIYSAVLRDKKSRTGENVGFRNNKGDMCTYQQIKYAFPYLYFKREVLADGISTTTLRITQEPCPIGFVCLQKHAPTLCPDFAHPFTIRGYVVQTIIQAMLICKILDCISDEVERANKVAEVLPDHASWRMRKVDQSIPPTNQWRQIYENIVYSVVESRIASLPESIKTLQNTGSLPIINADPADAILGTGVSFNVYRWIQREYDLMGRNYLGLSYERKRATLG